MADSPVLTVRLAPEELERLDRIASDRGLTRSALVQSGIRDVIAADERQRAEAALALRERLRPAIEEQDALREHASLSAEFRRL